MVQQHVVATGHLGIQTLCSMFGVLIFIHIYTHMFDIYISAFMIFYLSIVYRSVGLCLVLKGLQYLYERFTMANVDI